MLKADVNFYNSIKEVMLNGYSDEDGKVRPLYKDGTPAHTKFVTQVVDSYDISKGELPITLLRPIAWKNGIKEVLWIYKEQSNSLKLLRDKYGVYWWNEWDIGDDTIGQTYGAIIRKYDLTNKLIEGIKSNPYSRYHMINMWQYSDFAEKHGLKPCAFMTIWSVRDKYLDCTLIQRSNDFLVAGHINKIQYVAFQMMIAKATGYEVGKFCHVTQNLHIYDRHFEQAYELMRRFEDMAEKEKNGEIVIKQPKLIFNPKSDNFYDFTIDDFELIDYEPMLPNLKFELGV